MNALLVDDERLARARLRTLLAVHADIDVIAEADSVDTAEAALLAHAPDVVFLDIEMPGGSGFELLARRRIAASVVFVTAYDEHAVRAFEVNAVDYLLKPVEPDRLAATVARLRARVAGGPDGIGPGPERICVSDRGAVRVLAIADILLVRAERDYTELVLGDGSAVLVKLPLSRWEARLGDLFVRVHRSTLVQLAAIERVERAEGSTSKLLVRGHASAVPVSRAHAGPLRAALARQARVPTRR